MFKELRPNLEIRYSSKEQVIAFILSNVPGHTEAELDRPVGDEQTTLNQFLENRKDGSEWTDPHGFKVNVVNGEFKIEKTKCVESLTGHRQKVYDLVREIKDKISFYPAANIAGYNDEQAWKIRGELMEKNPDGVVQGLAGITSPRAWQIRESLIEVCPHSVARSLVGLDNEKAWQMRKGLLELIDREGVANGLAESVAFLDDEQSWRLRERLEDICPLNVLEGLNGLDSERAWSLREKYKDKYPREVVASLIGLRNGKADQWRREFLEKGQIEGVILSYLGDDSDKAWALREKYLDEYAFAVGTSMGGLENDKSWKLRNRLKEKAEKGEDQHVYKGLAQSLSSYMSVALKMRNS